MMFVVHEFVAPAEQLPLSRRHFVPPALTTSGNLGEGARFRYAAMGGWGRALHRSDVDNSNCVLFPLVGPCTDDCWLKAQLWILDRLQKKPFEIGCPLLL